MKEDWKKLWDANPGIFVVSGWEECPEDKRKSWHLPPQFNYFCAGNLKLRVGIIAVQDEYKEEDFLLAGILWSGRLGNGIKTVIYFVAQEFTPVFLGAMGELGGSLTAKAVFWRKKLTPSLYPVTGINFLNSFQLDPGTLRSGWELWERELNPVAWNHLGVIKDYFEGLARRRVRTVILRNKIVFCWGNIQIAEIKKKGNKFELATKVKWTKNKSIASKFIKSGWVDFSGKINEDFCRSIEGIIDLLENMEISDCFETNELLQIKLINDKEFVPELLGQYFEFPWLLKDKNDILYHGQLLYFWKNQQINIVKPILEKPFQKVVHALLAFTVLENSEINTRGLPGKPDIRWNRKIYLLSEDENMEELRLCQSWLKKAERFPIINLPKDWRTEGFKKYKGLALSDFEDSFLKLY